MLLKEALGTRLQSDSHYHSYVCLKTKLETPNQPQKLKLTKQIICSIPKSLLIYSSIFSKLLIYLFMKFP